MSDLIPMAFLLSRWFVDFCEALIEKACNAWEDDEEEEEAG